MKIVRWVAIGVVAVLAAGLAVPYVDAGGYRDRIQEALERALDRKVKVGKVRFNLLTGPGFTVEDVTISDDPGIGIEPLAYVESLSARVRLTTLWTPRLSFSNLRLDNPTVNLAKADSGVWNFQLLGRAAPAARANGQQFPSIQVRSGRINFKFGDYKTIFYLSDSDLDVSPIGSGALDIRFSGQPARTDQAAQSFGRMLARGIWKRGASGPGELDINAELESSSIPDLCRLVQGRAVDLHGTVSSRAHIKGPITALDVSGQLRLEDVHRWDLTPSRTGGAWDLPYHGTADLSAQRIEAETAGRQDPQVPFIIRFRASEYLSDPKWAANLEIKEAPLSGFLDLARHLGATLPAGLSADGKVAGSVGYAKPGGMQGQLLVHDSSVRLEKTGGLDLRRAEFMINGSQIEILPSTVVVADGQTAEVEGSYDSDAGRFELKVETRGMNVGELHTGSARLFGAGGVPVLEACRQGVWRGWLNYTLDGNESTWSGQFELQNARVHVDGVDGLVRVSSAQVHLDGPKIAISNLRGHAGQIDFRGEYARDRSGRPDRLKLQIDEMEIAQLESLMLPALKRDGGILARFRLRTPPAPEWMRARRVSANISVARLIAGEGVWTVDHVRALWEGTTVKLLGLAARQGSTEASGSMLIDLRAPAPTYEATGKVENVEFSGGRVDLEGTAESRGVGADLLSGAHASGTFTGENFTIPPEADIRSITGKFELLQGFRIRLSGIQALQGQDMFAGQGSSQPDGKILLELASPKRQMRVLAAKQQ